MHKKLECPPSNILVDLIQGKIIDPELSEISLHLEDCAACQEKAKTLSPHDTLLESLRAEAPAEDKIARDVPRPLVEKIKQIAERRLDASSDTVGLDSDALAPQGEPDLDFLAPAQQAGEIGRLGNYRILQVLGKGGMGMVFLAEDPELDRKVALKVMLPKIAANPQAKQRFLREARAAAKLKSDHIVTIHQVSEDRGVPFLAMELLEGAPLDSLLQGGQRLEPAQIVRIGREIAQGLEAAHAKDMIHRDIKPGNLWLDQSHGDRVKILDFGLARTDGDDVHLTQSGVIVGTPAYMSPEQARGEKVDARADLFSLGCVLYRLCVGDIPFKAETTMGVLTALAVHDPVAPAVLNPNIPPALSEFIMQLLAKDPARRPASAKAVIARFNEIESSPMVRGGPSVVMQLPPSPVLGTIAKIPDNRPVPAVAPARARSGPGWLIATALVLLLLGGGAFGVYQLFFDTPQGRIVVQIDDDDIEARFKKGKIELYDKAGKLLYTLEPSQRKKDLPPGNYGIKVAGVDGLHLDTDQFEMKRGDKVIVKILLDRVALGKKDVEIKQVTDAPAVPRGDYALELDGKTKAKLPVSLDVAKPFTLEAYITNKAGSGTPIFGPGFIGLDAGNEWGFMLRNAKNSDNVLVKHPAMRNKKTHIAGVYTGKDMLLFVDGKLVQSAANAPGKATVKLEMGFGTFQGIVDEIRVSKVARYDRDFTPAQRHEPDADTLALYHFDEGQGDVLTDSSGNRHHGKIVSAGINDPTKAASPQCLIVWQGGGPSQMDTFDPKPVAEGISVFKPIDTSVPGLQFAETLPHLAKQAHHLAVIRTITDREKGEHRGGTILMQTGREPGEVEFPSLGSVLGRELERPGLPRFIGIGIGAAPKGDKKVIWDGFGAGFLGEEFDPVRLSFGKPKIEDFESTAKGNAAVLLKNILPAYASLTGPAGKDQRYMKGTKWLLLAKNLLEQGAPVVEVAVGGWDMHADVLNGVPRICEGFDQPCAALLADLEASGRLKNTLVVIMGEFGRTPTLNKDAGRDHWTKCYSVVLGGGLIKGGRAIGKTSDDGSTIVDRPVSVAELHATIYAALGIDPSKPLGGPMNLNTPLVERGTKPIAELLPSDSERHGKIVGAKWVKMDGAAITPAESFALQFDGKGTVDVPTLDFVGKRQVTIEAHVLLNSVPSKFVPAPNILGVKGQMELWHNPGKNAVSLQSLGNGNTADSNLPLPARWIHIAAVRDGNRSLLFVDGKLSGEVKHADTPIFAKSANHFKIVREFFAGQVREVRVSQSARYLNDFTPAKRFAPDANTLALYHCDEGQGDKLTDSSGNGHHGKIVGAKWVKVDGTPIPAPSEPGDYALRFKYQFPKKGVTFPTLAVDLAGSITIEAYCIPDEVNNGMLIGTQKFAVGITANQWGMTSGAGFAAGAKGPKCIAGKLVHIAAVRTVDGATLFVDGKRVDQIKNTERPTGSDTFILGPGFNGVIDEVRISKSARYDADFTPQTRFTPDKDTIALFHLDEGYGDVLTDSSGNGYHGRVENASWVNADGSPVTTRFNDFALEFSGQGKVEVPTLSLAKEKLITVEAFVKLHRSPEKGVVNLLGHGNLSSSLETTKFHLNFFGYSTSGGTSQVPGDAPIRTHVAAVLTESSIELYRDGKKGATRPIDSRKQVNLPEFLIGDLGFMGVIDEVRISKTVRYSKDFAPQRRFEPDADTLALYHCDEGQGDKLTDSSGNGHHGKIVGAKWVQADGTPIAPIPLPGTYALSFDETAKASLPVPLDYRGPLTLEAYVTRSDDVQRYVFYTTIIAGKSAAIGLRGGPNWQAFLRLKEHTNANSEVQVVPGKKTHVATVFTGSQFRLYVDGALAASQEVKDTAPDGIPSPTLQIGGSTINKFAGIISELRVSKIARYDKDFMPQNRFETDKDTLALYHFDEGSGDKLTDSSGNGHHGKIVGAKWVKVDGAAIVPITGQRASLYFDGDSKVECPQIALPKHLTFEAIIKQISPPKNNHLLFQVNTLGKELALKAGRVRSFHVYHKGKQTMVGHDSSMEQSDYIHVAGVFDSGNISLFINGKLAERKQVIDGPNFSGSNSPVLIGPSFHGLIHVVRISASARYKDDFTPQYRFTPDADTIALYHCDEGSGDILKDSSGNGHHGKIVGAKWVRADGTAIGAVPPLDPAWLKAVAAMAGKGQLQAVEAELMKRNPGFDGKLLVQSKGNEVYGVLGISKGQLSDISPLQGLSDLRHLQLAGILAMQKKMKGAAIDLSPLKGLKLTSLECDNVEGFDLSLVKDMKLTKLDCVRANISDLTLLKGMPLTNLNVSITKVSDLSPLKGLPLNYLRFDDTTVSDLSPLKGMPLTELHCQNTKVSDLSPLKGMPLTMFNFSNTKVSDLSPLKGMPLTVLYFANTQVFDLSPLKGMPLKQIYFDFKANRGDAELLRSIKTLETINGQPVAEFWKAPGMSSLLPLDPATHKAAPGVPDQNPGDVVQPAAKRTTGASAPALVMTLAMGKIPAIFGSRWTSSAERVVDRDPCHDDASCTSTSFRTVAGFGVRRLEHSDERAG